jgi:hypothetical protein
VVLAQQDFLRDHEELDALAEAASVMAGGVRSIVRQARPPRPFGEALPEPDGWRRWRRCRATSTRSAGGRAPGARDGAGDSFAFHGAFPNLPVPGEAFGVLRGPLPGTGGIHGRLACCAERQMQLPIDLEHWLAGAGGDVGCDVAMLPAAPGAIDMPDDGERVEDLRVAVTDGVLLAWRRRPRWQADGAALDRLASDTVRIAAGRGVLATA